jgi:hypothetical protein
LQEKENYGNLNLSQGHQQPIPMNPYIGDESITPPPAFAKAFNTCFRDARFTSLDPTSNDCQVPRPMVGSSSPVLWIVLIFLYFI